MRRHGRHEVARRSLVAVLAAAMAVSAAGVASAGNLSSIQADDPKAVVQQDLNAVNQYIGEFQPDLQWMANWFGDTAKTQFSLDRNGMQKWAATYPNTAAALERVYIQTTGAPFLSLFVGGVKPFQNISAPEEGGGGGSWVSSARESAGNSCSLIGTLAGPFVLAQEDSIFNALAVDIHYWAPYLNANEVNGAVQTARDAFNLYWYHHTTGIEQEVWKLQLSVQHCRDIDKILNSPVVVWEPPKPTPTPPIQRPGGNGGGGGGGLRPFNPVGPGPGHGTIGGGGGGCSGGYIIVIETYWDEASRSYKEKETIKCSD